MDRQLCDQIIDKVGLKLKEAKAPFECLEVYWQPSSPSYLRIYIDGPNGVNLDDCSLVSSLLEGEELVPARASDSFDLEVSSPGVDRPLRLLKDFLLYVGEEVFFELSEPLQNRKKSAGKLISVSQEGNFHVLIDGKLSWSFSWNHIIRAHLVYDWNRL